jgi:hypothetical protein
MDELYRYIPKGAREIVDLESDAVAYVNDDGGFYAIGYSGKRKRHDFNYRFRTVEARDKYVQDYFTRRRAVIRDKSERRQERKKPTTLKVGDILVESWGYEQTNVTFYEVLEVKPSGLSVVIQQLSSDTIETGFMCGKVTPIPGTASGDKMLKRVSFDSVRTADYSRASKWDGRPCYASWYG